MRLITRAIADYLAHRRYKKMLAATYAKGPKCGGHVLYNMVGLGGECGEILNVAQKCMRGDFPEAEFKRGGSRHQKLVGELGGVAWFLHQLCEQIGVSIEEVKEQNRNTLLSRKARGSIKGDGDDR